MQICQAYVKYIKQRNGNCPTIASDDGYDAASTKDTVLVRRAKGRPGKRVRLNLNNQLSMSKSNFLLSNDNKQNLQKLVLQGIMAVVMLTFLLYRQH